LIRRIFSANYQFVPPIGNEYSPEMFFEAQTEGLPIKRATPAAAASGTGTGKIAGPAAPF
jgi:hypothetical protein